MELAGSKAPHPFVERFDGAVERLIRFTLGLKLRDPIRVTLADHRRRTAEHVAATFGPAARTLAAAVLARDPAAIADLDALVDVAVAEMRAARPATHPLVGRIEHALYRQAPELLDDPSFPVDARAAALDKLHRLNVALGSYDGFLEALLPLVEIAEAAGRSPVRIHDLAAGHAGFAIFLKQRLGARVEVEASDLKAEYLEIGRRRAAAAGVEIELFVADALALDDLRERGVDVICCTQSVHHFTPGMVTRMLGEAVAAARTGVCLIDGERSWLMFVLIGLATALHGRSWVLFHDGLVSLRRMFYEEELGLFGALAPAVAATARLETGVLWPAHAYLRATRKSALG
jgi:SAM-dependent methyltransferase